MSIMPKRLSTVFSILLVLFFLANSNVVSAITLEFEHLFSFGKFGSGKEEYDGPVDIVEDEREDLYILDAGNYRVQKVDYRGDYITDWGKRGFRDGMFKDPTSIAIDSEGNIYVVDTGNHRIQKFSQDGEFIASFGKIGTARGRFRYPTDITFDRDGNIYVCDSGNKRIQKFDKEFKFIQEWGKFERKGKEIKDPYSVAYSDEGFGYIYVSDKSDCVIQKFDTNGNLKDVWEVHPRGKGYVCGPLKLRVEPRNYYLYVADRENNVIFVFNRNGEKIGEIEENFDKPSGLYVNDSEELFIVDTGNNKIHKFRRE